MLNPRDEEEDRTGQEWTNAENAINVTKQENIKAIVLAGRMKIFCVILDSRSPLLEKSAITEADIKSEANLLHESSLKPKLSIAAVNGKALGAGFELALLCGMIVASPTAQFAFPEITKHGFIPGFGGISQLCARIGSSCNCLDIILSGDIIGSDKAMSIGLINRVIDEVDCTEFQNKSVEFAQRVSNSRDLAVDAAKAIIDRYQQIRSEDYSSVEHDWFVRCLLEKQKTSRS
ncbi:hypothetical protein ACOME3_004272 [Neoechinorhynchus agilis]